eukprot:UN34585
MTKAYVTRFDFLDQRVVDRIQDEAACFKALHTGLVPLLESLIDDVYHVPEPTKQDNKKLDDPGQTKVVVSFSNTHRNKKDPGEGLSIEPPGMTDKKSSGPKNYIQPEYPSQKSNSELKKEF